MFFHGIDLKYLWKQYPCLFPDAHASTKTKSQIEDREHLIQKFGFEPVHLLESNKDFPTMKCLKECFSFGEIIFAFHYLKGPIWQISSHEIAVPYLDVRKCKFIFVRSRNHREQVERIFCNKNIFQIKNKVLLVE
ncbi:MAG TPA: hypothetical protein VJ824_01775 [Bacillota bacterium]|nr:hypothetical protein [Bacillota bacterium]